MSTTLLFSIGILLAYAALLSVLIHLYFQKYRCAEKNGEVLQVLRCESKFNKLILSITIAFIFVMFMASIASAYLKLKAFKPSP